MKNSVKKRHWKPPTGNDPVEMADFRAAVVQNVIAIWVRNHKNSQNPKITQPELVDLDTRPDSVSRWNARLCGREAITLDDIATMLVIFPGAMPPEYELQQFLDVAEKKISPPPGWGFPDT